MKEITSIYIERETKVKAKRLCINISAFCEKSLTDEINRRIGTGLLIQPIDHSKRIKVVCHLCGHSWETKSHLYAVSCSACGAKVKNPVFISPRYRRE